MNIHQEANSYETVTEVDPMDIAEIFGNVGGFWGKSERDELLAKLSNKQVFRHTRVSAPAVDMPCVGRSELATSS